MKYSFDTSAILHAWRRSYPPKSFPQFWQKVDEIIEKGELKAVDEVLVELEKKDDEVYKWPRARKSKVIVPIDEDIQKVVQTILQNHRRLVDTRKNRTGADPFVIAVAKIKSATVVTNENPGSAAKPNIPDVCTAMGIRSINILELIQEQKWVF